MKKKEAKKKASKQRKYRKPTLTKYTNVKRVFGYET